MLNIWKSGLRDVSHGYLMATVRDLWSLYPWLVTCVFFHMYALDFFFGLKNPRTNINRLCDTWGAWKVVWDISLKSLKHVLTRKSLRSALHINANELLGREQEARGTCPMSLINEKGIGRKTSAPIGAWKCNLLPFWEVMTDRSQGSFTTIKL